MPLYFLIAVIVIGAIAAAALSLYAVVIVIPIVLLIVGYMLVKSRSDDPHAGTIERTRKDPTGTVRTPSAGAGTANERVGQG